MKHIREATFEIFISIAVLWKAIEAQEFTGKPNFQFCAVACNLVTYVSAG